MPIQTALDSISQNQGSPFGFKNRIINGSMVFDQRNAGASVTPTGGSYITDRWAYQGSQSSKVTMRQMESLDNTASNYESGSAPSGFKNALKVTSSSSYSVTSNDYFQLYQIIEGYNIADLGWGTSTASPVTLSFWVKSSLTGTFGASLATNNGTVWSFPFNYTITNANTWTYITVNVPAATGAVPYTNNSYGIFVRFGLGSTGSNVGGTPGVWTSAGNYIQPSGTVSVVGTNAATWYITGVQLEKGNQATSFDYRPYGTELALCQRYYQAFNENSFIITGTGYNVTSGIKTPFAFPVAMRAAPAATISNGSNGGAPSGLSVDQITTRGCVFNVYPTSSATNMYYSWFLYLASEL